MESWLGCLALVDPAHIRKPSRCCSRSLFLAHRVGRPRRIRSICGSRQASVDQSGGRYDLSFTDLDPETLPGFVGPMQACRVSRHRIAGFPVDRDGTGTTDQGKLWFARLIPGDLMVPVRMEFGSEFGSFTADLAELRGRGVDLHFTE
jgi:hypothetical protein